MEKRSESFGRLLKAGMAAVAHLEGKTQQAIEREFGALIGVAGPTMQRYKAGHLPPDPRKAEQLAEQCLRRGLFGLAWLERFLQAARLPAYNIRALAAQLAPESALGARPEGPRPNLPPPTYARFIMRSEAYAAVLEGLRSELPLTLIVSLGGMGKTSLARALAGACLEGRAAGVQFASAVWVSDKDHPGTTNLSTVLDVIARVLDYPGLAAMPFAERQREVEDLLRRQPVLLVVDNADTITDAALLAWLARLPGPSKALVTSRFALPPYLPVFAVELGPLARPEIRALIADWLPRSRLRGVPGALDQIMPIAEAAGGNAKAIELALGLLQHRVPHEILAELRVASAGHLDELFGQAWDLLDGAEQRLLLALPHFPASASAEALAYCADLSAAAFLHGADRLASLSLLDTERGDLLSPPRYNAHPLVRAYALARLPGMPEHAQLALRERWLIWCVQMAQSVGFCWDDLDRLDRLDAEHAAIQSAIAWATTHGRDRELITLVEGIRYYYNVRGLWGDAELHNNELRARAAQRLDDIDNQALALAHHVQILCKQGRIAEARPLLDALLGLGESRYRQRLSGMPVEGLPADAAGRARFDDAAFEYGHARAHFALAQGDLAQAEQHWRALLSLASLLGGQKHVVNRRWLATVLLRRGQLVDARQMFAESLDDARRIHDLRSLTGNTLKLASLDIAAGKLAAAASALAECRAVATRYHDRRRLAECHLLAARLCLQQDDRASAAAEFGAAQDLFERLGMRQAAEEARAAGDKLAHSVQHR
jgi:hypothetical protein